MELSESDLKNQINDMSDDSQISFNSSRDDDEDSQIPLLYVDVNIGKGVFKRIIIYEGDDPKQISELFAQDNNLNLKAKNKLEKLLKQQMEGVLCKIIENEEDSDSSNYL